MGAICSRSLSPFTGLLSMGPGGIGHKKQRLSVLIDRLHKTFFSAPSLSQDASDVNNVRGQLYIGVKWK